MHTSEQIFREAEGCLPCTAALATFARLTMVFYLVGKFTI